MAAGSLRDRITLQKRLEVNPDAPNDYGSTVSTWTSQGDRWAGFTYLRAGEAVLAGRLEGRVMAIVRLRADALTRTVGADWRLIDQADGVVYAVRSVNPDPEGDRAWVDLMAESGVAA